MIEGRTTVRKILEEGHFETSPFDDARIVLVYVGRHVPPLMAFMPKEDAVELAEALRKRTTFARDDVELAWIGIAGPARLRLRTAKGRKHVIELEPPDPGELADLIGEALDEASKKGVIGA